MTQARVIGKDDRGVEFDVTVPYRSMLQGDVLNQNPSLEPESSSYTYEHRCKRSTLKEVLEMMEKL